MSVAIVPRVVSTPRTRPPSTTSPVASVEPNARAPPAAAAARPIASAPRTAFAIPSRSTSRPPTIRSGSMSGMRSATSAGDSSAASRP